MDSITETAADVPSSFGARLAQARRAAGLTQEQLALGMGADGRDLVKGSISSWEKDASQPTAKQLALLCARLGVTADHLLFGAEHRKAA